MFIKKLRYFCLDQRGEPTDQQTNTAIYERVCTSCIATEPGMVLSNTNNKEFTEAF